MEGYDMVCVWSIVRFRADQRLYSIAMLYRLRTSVLNPNDIPLDGQIDI